MEFHFASLPSSVNDRQWFCMKIQLPPKETGFRRHDVMSVDLDQIQINFSHNQANIHSRN